MNTTTATQEPATATATAAGCTATEATPIASKGARGLAPVTLHLTNILVPLDFSELSLKALHYAVPFAQQFHAKLTLVHVVELQAYTPELPYPPAMPPYKAEEIEKALEEVRDANVPAGVPVEVVACYDFAADAVVQVARERKADLIITATHGRTGLKHLLIGSTAEKIVRLAPCPVLVVREKEHDFV
ncbi:MAG: universal stress protein [Chthoniobacter sp.]|nr:universal stress protein [Chthoniobacter sp.]